MDITHVQVRAAYEFLRQCPPFKDWGLPPAEAVRFDVLRTPHWQADYDPWNFRSQRGGRIRVSRNRVATADRLLVTVAHEMAHMVQDLWNTRDAHNALFAALGAEICEQLGFDPKEF